MFKIGYPLLERCSIGLVPAFRGQVAGRSAVNRGGEHYVIAYPGSILFAEIPRGAVNEVIPVKLVLVLVEGLEIELIEFILELLCFEAMLFKFLGGWLVSDCKLLVYAKFEKVVVQLVLVVVVILARGAV